MSPKSHHHPLGSFGTRISGTQYYEASVRAGEKVFLERDPDNRFDSNAIRLDNEDFDPVGHLPRRIAAWLAPLIDEGSLVPTGQANDPHSLRVTLHVTRSSLLHRRRQPSSGRQALHNLVIQAFRDARDRYRPEVVTGLARHLRRLAHRDLYPATHMLLTLLPELARSNPEPELGPVFEGCPLGAPLALGDLTLFPLLTSTDTASPPSFDLLASALQQGTAQVTEIGESGSVPRLLLHNRGERPLLAPEGEILVGAKQNRILQFSILAPALETLEVPVCCVEQGRWSWSTRRTFDTDTYAPPSLRREVKEAQLSEGGRRTQARAWQAVESFLHDVEADSPTRSMTDGVAKARKPDEKLPELPDGARGVLAAHGGELLGLDLFATAQVFGTQWPRLAEGYQAEATRRKQPTAPPLTPEKARTLLTQLADQASPATPQLGLGTRYDLRTPELVGSILAHENTLYHASAFGTPPS